jgi:hypothetical protein
MATRRRTPLSGAKRAPLGFGVHQGGSTRLAAMLGRGEGGANAAAGAVGGRGSALLVCEEDGGVRRTPVKRDGASGLERSAGLRRTCLRDELSGGEMRAVN